MKVLVDYTREIAEAIKRSHEIKRINDVGTFIVFDLNGVEKVLYDSTYNFWVKNGLTDSEAVIEALGKLEKVKALMNDKTILRR